MRKYRKKNLENIQNIFEQKTGVPIVSGNLKQTFGWKKSLMAVATILCFLGLSAFAYSKFSSLDEDSLSLCAYYQGDGIFEIRVANLSDKDLKLQNKVKLMQWSTAREIAGDSQKVRMENRTIKAHSEQTVLVDLSGGYDIGTLEKELPQGDWYYLVLTNNNFAFGQDWMCDITFDTDYQPERVIYAQREEYIPDFPDSYKLAFEGWSWPAESKAVSYLYGQENEGNGTVSDHVNIVGETGDEIYAVADAKVLETGFNSTDGNYIIIAVGDEVRVKYGHLKECSVSVQDEVVQGQMIAVMGKSGMATGPNLALTVWVNGEAVNPLAEE